MKRFLGLILALAFVTGCSTTSTTRKTEAKPYFKQYKADKQLQIYARLLQAYGALLGVDINTDKLRLFMYKTNSERFNSYAGYCDRNSGKMDVYINQKAFNSYDDYGRELLVLHELGHCVLNLPHDPSMTSNGIPLSIMHPHASDSNLYYVNYVNYIRQMFQMYKANHSPIFDVFGGTSPEETPIKEDSDYEIIP